MGKNPSFEHCLCQAGLKPGEKGELYRELRAKARQTVLQRFKAIQAMGTFHNIDVRGNQMLIVKLDANGKGCELCPAQSFSVWSKCFDLLVLFETYI